MLMVFDLRSVGEEEEHVRMIQLLILPRFLEWELSLLNQPLVFRMLRESIYE